MTTIKSIEEKARRYDEVFSAAKEWYNNPNSSSIGKSYLYAVLPELKESKESEDERIRKALMQNLKERFGTKGNMGEGLDMPDVLAWLEKQGKNNMGISEATKQKLEDNLNKALEKETPESWNEFLEKQGKQNHTNKFPKYDKGDILTDGENKYEVLSWDYTETGIAAYYMKGDGCKFSWNCEEADKKLYIVEQNPAWGEEDENHVKSILSTIECCKAQFPNAQAVVEAYNADVEWLKSIKDRVQPQSKQEWSEEDEKIYNLLYEEYKNVAYYSRSREKAEDIAGEVLGWLKSLKHRYTWKPSDEQMEALAEALSLAKNCGEEGAFDLRTLYEDLKKLREE